MAKTVASVPILTYHSISDGGGPTSLPLAVFRAQMQTVADLGVDVVGLDWIERWLRGEAAPVRPAIVITFDDGFGDFAEAAYPVLDRHKFPASVFAPTAVVGGAETWAGASDSRRALMDWRTIRALSDAGVSFGSHARTHKDLTTLTAVELEDELSGSRRELEERIGKAATHFAPPYGRSNRVVRHAIAKHYQLSVGVRLDVARRTDPIFDLPRVEMHYYRDIKRWRAFLENGDAFYFQARRAARTLREGAFSLSRRPTH